MNLIEFISPDMNVPRSINLERDNYNLRIINDYHLTNKTMEILRRFTRALLGERVSAWSLTGPYGMGKSSFCNYLLTITGPQNDTRTKAALKALKAVDPSLYGDFKTGANQVTNKKGFFRVYVTAAYESVNHSLARGLQEALENDEEKSALEDLIASTVRLIQEKVIPSQDLLSLFKEAMKIMNQPMIIILDEFGKNLDYLSHHSNRGDIFILQQLAEMDAVFLWVVLHQAFDEYASGLSSAQRQEWSKVQGRFEDISFVESTAQMLYLMHKALKKQLSISQKQKIDKWAQQALDAAYKTIVNSKYLFDAETVANIYPFHPLAALALIELCRKFAQNDRTLLSFICSGDPQALPVLLNNLTWFDEEDKPVPVVGLDYLYDYFVGITSSTYNSRPESQRWLEIDGIIQQAGNVSLLETAILKSIGVLNLLSTSLGVKASPDTIISIIEYSHNVGREEIIEAMKNLVGKGVLIFREYAGEYRLWEGSDFDVSDAIREQRSKMAISSLYDLLQEYLPLSPLIAARHAFTSGTVRRFERRWLSSEQINDHLRPQKGFDGLLLYTFGTEPKLAYIPDKCADQRPLVIAYITTQSTLHELALEVAAVRAVFAGSPELNHDGVARKEIKYRIKAAEQNFREYINEIYTPGSEDLQWYINGENTNIKSNKELSASLSNLCDSTYYKSPYIGNEMISYEVLSSAAAKARRELIEAMASRANEWQFGLSGYGPEVAVYRSLIAKQGLHVDDGKLGWNLSMTGSDPRLNGLWEEINTIIHNSGEKGCTVQALLEHIQYPPFGMRLGPAPIYICLYLLVNSEEIAIFREGSYLPYLSAAEISLLVKRPDLFVLKPAIAEQWESAIFSIYHELFNNRQLREDINLRNRNMLGVVGPLIKFLNDLPNYSKNTRKISREAQLVRSAIQNSVDPMKLLIHELPEALGVVTTNEAHHDIDWQVEFQERLRAIIGELEQAYPRLNSNIQQTLLDVFGETDINQLMGELITKIKDLYEICDEKELKALMKAILRESNDADQWSRGIAGIVVKKPPQSWGDDDIAPFSIKIREYAERIEQLQALAATNGLVLKGRKLISVLNPNGTSKRFIVPIDEQPDPELSQKVRELTSYPRDKIEVLVGFLLDYLDRGESDAG